MSRRVAHDAEAICVCLGRISGGAEVREAGWGLGPAAGQRTVKFTKPAEAGTANSSCGHAEKVYACMCLVAEVSVRRHDRKAQLRGSATEKNSVDLPALSLQPMPYHARSGCLCQSESEI